MEKGKISKVQITYPPKITNGERFIEANLKEYIHPVEITCKNGVVNIAPGKGHVYLPYLDRSVTVVKLPRHPKSDLGFITDVMDGCNLLYIEDKDWLYIIHDNQTMNQQEDDDDDLGIEPEDHELPSCSFSEIPGIMKNKDLVMTYGSVSSKDTRGIGELLQRRAYRKEGKSAKNLTILPMGHYEPKTKKWTFNFYIVGTDTQLKPVVI